MMMIWNRKEVFFGFSLQKFNEMRQMLSENKIEYDYRLINNNNNYFWQSRRAVMGTFGEKAAYSITYYIYVHKKDYEHACAVLKILYR